MFYNCLYQTCNLPDSQKRGWVLGQARKIDLDISQIRPQFLCGGWKKVKFALSYHPQYPLSCPCFETEQCVGKLKLWVGRWLAHVFPKFGVDQVHHLWENDSTNLPEEQASKIC